MIFHTDLAEKILAGEKTVTRRRARRLLASGDYAPCAYTVGRTYSIQPGRGKPGIGRLRVTKVDRVALGSITKAEARLEGFATPEGFYARWREMYGDGSFFGSVWRIEFELVSQ